MRLVLNIIFYNFAYKLIFKKMKKLLFLLLIQISIITLAQSSDINNGLVAYFPLDNDVLDYSPLHIDGVNHNAVPGHSGNRLFYHFNVAHAYILAGNSDRGITNEVSVSVWIRTTSDTLQWIVGKYDHRYDKGFQVVMQNGHAQLRGRAEANEFYILQDDDLINDGNWHHIVGLFNKNKWTLIVDCQIKNTLQTTTTNPRYDIISQPLAISIYTQLNNGYDPMHFNGDIDEIRIYNRTLSLCEICELHRLDSNEETSGIENNNSPETINQFLKVFPNPAEYFVQIKLLKQVNKKSLLQMFNMEGKLILEKTFDKTTKINTASLPQGTYVIRVMNGKNKYTEKLIIN